MAERFPGTNIGPTSYDNGIVYFILGFTVVGTPNPSNPTTTPVLIINSGNSGGSYNGYSTGYGPATYPDLTAPIVYTTNEDGSPCGGQDFTGSIVIIDYSTTFDFESQIQTAQSNGAIGVILVNNSNLVFTPGLGAPSVVTIPSLLITPTDGQTIESSLMSCISSTNITATILSPSSVGSALYALDAKNGKTLFTYDINIDDIPGNTSEGGVTVYDGKLYITSVNGVSALKLIDPDSKEEPVIHNKGAISKVNLSNIRNRSKYGTKKNT